MWFYWGKMTEYCLIKGTILISLFRCLEWQLNIQSRICSQNMTTQQSTGIQVHMHEMLKWNIYQDKQICWVPKPWCMIQLHGYCNTMCFFLTSAFRTYFQPGQQIILNYLMICIIHENFYIIAIAMKGWNFLTLQKNPRLF